MTNQETKDFLRSVTPEKVLKWTGVLFVVALEVIVLVVIIIEVARH